jgi:hypothetical protein
MILRKKFVVKLMVPLLETTEGDFREGRVTIREFFASLDGNLGSALSGESVNSRGDARESD